MLGAPRIALRCEGQDAPWLSEVIPMQLLYLASPPAPTAFPATRQKRAVKEVTPEKTRTSIKIS